MYTVTPAGTHLAVRCTYDEGQTLKALCGKGYIWWQPATRSWLIAPHTLGALIDAVGAHLAPLDYECLRIAYPHTTPTVRRGKR